MSKREIVRRERVSINFVLAWTKTHEQDVTVDNRGWQKGKRRKWDRLTVSRVKEIREKLNNDSSRFYIGPEAIMQEWKRLYPSSHPPPIRTITRMLVDLGLSKKRRRDRHKGSSRYLCYPEHTIYYLLGSRVLEADFIGRKYITGRSKPLNFIGFSFKRKPRLRYYKRVEGETADNLICQCKVFFANFEKPDFLKVDNCAATIGSVSGKRNISRTIAFLLENRVVPVFSVPRKPFSQASIEGNNSVFSRRFWNKIKFKNLKEVDEKLELFNQASKIYTNYRMPKKRKKIKKIFVPKVYFIRQVKEDKERNGKAFIDVLNEKITLPLSYINYFVLAEWNVKEEILHIHFEKELKPKIIKKIPFKINQRSRKRCSQFI